MSRSQIIKFKKLYNLAKERSSTIKELALPYVKEKQQKNFSKSMEKLSEQLFAVLDADQKKERSERRIDTEDTNIKNFLLFVQENQPSGPTFDCSPPLSPGDLTFNDIAGQEQTKQRLRISYILPFEFPRLFKTLGKGTLLYGVPGTGKSLIAKASVNEIEDAAFFNVSPADIKGKYEGETEKNIQKWFKCAQEYVENEDNGAKFAIIFFDEFDSIATARGDDAGMVRTVNMLLQMMDGIESSPYVSVLAATNYPNTLDDAILRRFTNRIFVDIPDSMAREYIIREVLAESYSNPLYSKRKIKSDIWKSDKRKNFNQTSSFISNIKMYGTKEHIEESGVFRTRFVDGILTNSLITELVEALGPKKEGLNVIEKIQSVSDSDSRLSTPHIFGFSPSDIRKIMEIAVSNASVRALSGYAIKRVFENSVKDQRDTHDYYVYDPDYDSSSRDDGIKIEELDKNDRERLLTFDIRYSDVLVAMGSYPSTIDNEKYLYLLKYSKQLVA